MSAPIVDPEVEPVLAGGLLWSPEDAELTPIGYELAQETAGGES